MATSKVQTGLRLEEAMLNKMTLIAKRQKRSLNAQIEFAVQEYIEKYEKDNGEVDINKDI